jgi:type II secretory pathway pseudopilin PulG
MSRLRSEDGVALVTAMVVMILLGALATGVLVSVDSHQRGTGDERVREAALQLAETALESQVVALGGGWPTTSALRFPASCASSGASAGCPTASTITGAFAGGDAAGGQWTTEVRDDLGLGAQHYRRDVLAAQVCLAGPPCTWDSNANGAMWVRASATVRGRTRTVVGLVRRPQIRVPLPRATAIAGRFETTNNGNKVIVDLQGCSPQSGVAQTSCSSLQPAPLQVRCTTAAPAIGDPCLSFRSGQISPAVTGVYDQDVLTPELLGVLRDQAANAGRVYSTTCPTAAQLSGSVVFVEDQTCTYTGGVGNSETQPGTLVLVRSSLNLGGNFRFYGLVLAANGFPPPSDAQNIVTLTGDAGIQGAIFIDGRGGLSIGASGRNLNYDPRALRDLVRWGPPAVERNSIRELTRAE